MSSSFNPIRLLAVLAVPGKLLHADSPRRFALDKKSPFIRHIDAGIWDTLLSSSSSSTFSGASTPSGQRCSIIRTCFFPRSGKVFTHFCRNLSQQPAISIQAGNKCVYEAVLVALILVEDVSHRCKPSMGGTGILLVLLGCSPEFVNGGGTLFPTLHNCIRSFPFATVRLTTARA